ncbi:MAG: hypothetical protein CMN29_31350 [Sandaracinus sp.]|nr:hypothetical protein [Myxococcales bacterium]MAT29382.1 hypothetical protein [Sandaracinus sp.]
MPTSSSGRERPPRRLGEGDVSSGPRKPPTEAASPGSCCAARLLLPETVLASEDPPSRLGAGRETEMKTTTCRSIAATLAALALGLATWPAASDAQDAEPSGGFEVYELVLSKALEDGRPVDPGTSFSRRDGRIYATIRVRNPERDATTIRVTWERAEGPASSGGIELDIPARPRYRTVARTGTGRAPGRYKCVVYDAEGRELASREFELIE